MVPLGIPAALFGFGILFAYTVEPFSLFNSELVIVIAYVTIMLPFATRSIAATLVTIGPEYSEAYRVAGAGSLRTLGMITLPLARRGLAVAWRAARDPPAPRRRPSWWPGRPTR